jgi:hypothetical protein
MRTSLQPLAIATLFVIALLLLCAPIDRTMDLPLADGGGPSAVSSMPSDVSLTGYSGSDIILAIIVALTIAEAVRRARVKGR